METFLALAPYLLVLLCPAVMIFTMRYMMKGMHGAQDKMNGAPSTNEMSSGRSTLEPIDATSSPLDNAQAGRS